MVRLSDFALLVCFAIVICLAGSSNFILVKALCWLSSCASLVLFAIVIRFRCLAFLDSWSFAIVNLRSIRFVSFCFAFLDSWLFGILNLRSLRSVSFRFAFLDSWSFAIVLNSSFRFDLFRDPWFLNRSRYWFLVSFRFATESWLLLLYWCLCC